MKTVKNVSKENQAVSWIPMFWPWDSQKVTDEQAERLLVNKNFQLVEKKKSNLKTTEEK